MRLQVEDATDENLMVQVAEGNKAAFRQLTLRHGMRYRALAYRFLGDMARAEDLVQDAFVKLWTNADSFNAGKAKFTTWFHRVVVNRCLDEKRKKTIEQLPENFDQVDQTASVEVLLEKDAVGKRLSRALDALSERQQTAVKLSYFDELSNQEAADVMGLKLKAFESLLVRSRTKMRQVLAAEKTDLLSALG
ncbi:sigma-70 family RNA polymerase sigma factor [Kordiimonas sp. SCSIO 12603]|uniref:sigma-70 family RNA polymerase sigma factor n=1 Tax=Kordiimonas sp. SCSIO 12603 TaxID=2829596 RepID=UPI0021041B1C|nr:sigma-70 family RNA polymerase sigma factor [Kordiimonas sp. SCSIO 12603]UTW59138.1 sigma-70 family RNA polymerase sigma factor [Kordiimonas sp. SCSIO 12603]